MVGQERLLGGGTGFTADFMIGFLCASFSGSRAREPSSKIELRPLSMNPSSCASWLGALGWNVPNARKASGQLAYQEV